MTTASKTHLVLIPAFNPGPLLFDTVRAARQHWNPVWVVVDGSTDGTTAELLRIQARDPGLVVILRPVNGGKGAAVLTGIEQAGSRGFTHVLTMDADGQHPAESIGVFMAASLNQPQALILGEPVFDASAPALRVGGRRISNFWANLETLWAGVHDSLFGFRVYPLIPLLALMRSSRWMRRFDFDVEAAVRLVWRGVPPLNISTRVRYLRPDQGGVSHFRYVRDNALLTFMHLRLFAGFLVRLPWLLARRWSKS